MTQAGSIRKSNKKFIAIGIITIVIVSFALISTQATLFQPSHSNPNTTNLTSHNNSSVTPKPTTKSAPSATPSFPSPTASVTSHPTQIITEATSTPTPTPTLTPTPTPSPLPTQSASPSPTPTATPTPSPTPTPTPTPTPDYTIKITGNINTPTILTLTQIKALPATTITVTLKSSGRPEENGVYQYTGITLWSILQNVGVKNDATMVKVSSTDGFDTLLLVSEVQNNSQILVAYMKDGQLITSESAGGEGPLRLIVGSDVFANRWAKFVSAIEVT